MTKMMTRSTHSSRDRRQPAHFARHPKTQATGVLLPCVLIGVALTALRIAVACETPMVPNMLEAYDDLLLVQYAQSVSNGDWLGAYGKMTLAKNPGYALALLLPGLLGIPYQALFITLQALSALCFALAVRDVLGGAPGALAAYLVLLLMPELFTFELFQRVYRMGIVIPFVTALFSSYIALYLRRDLPPQRLVPWAVVAGCSLFAICILKEDGVWAFPYVGVVSAILLAHWVRGHTSSPVALVARLVVLALPVALLLAGTGAIRARNYQAYGVATTCERTDSGFSRFTSRLLMIEGDGDNPRAWVSESSLDQAIEASPTLASIEPELRETFGAWPDAGNGDLIFWVLRSAYEQAGGYADGASTDAFWSAAAQELDDALRSGALTRRKGLQAAASLPSVAANDVLPLARACAHNLRVVLFHEQAHVWRGPGNGQLGAQQVAARLLNGATAVDDGTEAPPPQEAALDLCELVLSLARGCDGALCAVRVLGLVALAHLALARRYSPARDACLFCLGLVLSMVVLLVGVSLQTSYLGDTADWAAYMYCAGIYPLTWMTTVLAGGVVVRYVVEGTGPLPHREKAAS